jgi:hypothetical protein
MRGIGTNLVFRHLLADAIFSFALEILESIGGFFMETGDGLGGSDLVEVTTSISGSSSLSCPASF